MKKPVFWIVITAASTLVALYDTWLETSFGGGIQVQLLPYIIGKVIALVFIPAIVVGLAVLFGKIVRKPISNSTKYTIACIVWLLLAASAINVRFYESTIRQSSFNFNPSGGEYEVSFRGNPP